MSRGGGLVLEVVYKPTGTYSYNTCVSRGGGLVLEVEYKPIGTYGYCPGLSRVGPGRVGWCWKWYINLLAPMVIVLV